MSPKLIRQNINFLEYPLWFQSIDPLPEEERAWKVQKGYTYETGYKWPNKTDMIFLLYLLKEVQENDWNESVQVSRFEVLKGCNLGRSKHWYERLEDCLHRWSSVLISFEGTFYDGKSYDTIQFGIVESWSLETKDKKLRVRFSPEWLQSINQSDFVKLLDFEQVKSLRSPLATRLYEILIKTFKGRKEWSISALKLAQKIPMKEKYTAHIIPKIKAAVNQINDKTALKIKLVVRRPERGKAIFDFEKQEVSKDNGKTAAPPSLKVVDVPQELEESLEALLEFLPKKERGKKTLRELLARKLRKHDFAFVRRNILYANKNAKSNYRTYLNKALKEDWGEGYEEDLTHARELAEAQRQAEELRKLQEEQERLLEAKIAQMARHKLSTLSQEQREERQAQAEAFISEGFPNLVGSSFFEGAVSQQLEIAMRQEIRDLLSKSREGS